MVDWLTDLFVRYRAAGGRALTSGCLSTQNPGASQGAGSAQTPGRGGERRPGVFGKLTAVHEQSIEITKQDGSVVTVKISGSTQFRKEREAAKLSDFKVGDTVFVRGTENADHTWTAEVVGERPNGGFGGGAGAASVDAAQATAAVLVADGQLACLVKIMFSAR